MKTIIKCIKCGEIKELAGRKMCKKCYDKEYHEKNKKKMNEQSRNYRYKNGGLSMSENKSCPSFLGIVVAEQLLSKVFKNVKQMPPNNSGYDFKCNKGMKVDVKSSVLHYDNRSLGNWMFRISKNKIADYFLCLAFDNREDLNPQHVWLIPGEEVNHLIGTTISKSTLSKWKKYELKTDKVVDCCDSMRK